MLAGIHFFGALLLLAASILILVTTITAPVIDYLSILRVDLQDSSAGSSIRFGTFGWCVIDGAQDGGNDCSGVHIGYDPTGVMRAIDSDEDFSTYAEDTTRALTRVMILHPIATGLCFIGALLGAVSGMIGSFIASLIALVSFVVALVALVCDFVLFSVLKSNINGNSAGNRAHYEVGIWTLLAGAVCALLAAVILFLTCCFGRRRDRKHAV